ncbi:PREDICTED: carboxymethylenebutenolidase homolog isoform X2 [Nelumbo nucifera]|uniref:Carboxymethylenebutenolidase homolog n=1 Tax=Nelumbo nucifera TaxID=4432 RepID=A0A1U8AWJ2_NELNU|nr:PREDICTED: carboxymethylenebutenolidase homolog isoform X2 [Nelumbo nucifera]
MRSVSALSFPFAAPIKIPPRRHFLSSAALPRPRCFPSRKCKNRQRRCSYYIKGLTYRVYCSSQVKLENGIDDESCELVNGVELILGEGADSVRAYLLKAVKNNNGNGILLLSDVYGFEDSSTRDFAYRVACNGYNVLVPDLFRGNPWVKDKPRDEYENWLSTQSPDRISKDISTSTKWMADEFVAAGITTKFAIIGFCFGGALLIKTLADDHDKYFGLGVCFYGTRMNPSLASNIQVPVLFVSGNEDPLCPVNTLIDMEKCISKGSRTVIFEGRGHGFAHRPKSPEEDSDAETAFVVMRNWLHEGLVVNAN